MYKLFIVDDEYEVIEGLRIAINWNEYEIEVCGDASNGAEAFDRIRELAPDILIIDMNMPIMGGIELMEKTKNAGIDTKFIILSGYDDFSYAQKAISLGASKYLLKPCRVQDILKAVLEVKELLEEQRHQERLMDQYKAQFMNNAHVLKDLLLTRILDGKTLIRDEVLQEEIHLYGIFLLDMNSTVILYKTEGNAYYQEIIPFIETEFKKKDLPNEVLVYKGGLVSICSSACSRDMLNVILYRITKMVMDTFSVHMTVVVGYEVAELDGLSRCYKKCREAMDTKSFLCIDEIIFLDDRGDEKKDVKTNKLIEASIEYIKNNYADDIKLETVANKIFITSGYLSILFKQTTGINFLDYLHRYRIQVSKDLMRDVRRKVYEIAYMVGYQDEKYFSRIFKKFTGLSPRQYRESLTLDDIRDE
ncbi:hypothetical protein FACS1894130_01500 [Spirochaetia bacterium]|nr:hypothetical protein FACS1894130_01500 [Spirochaetia bacterium]